MFEVSNVQGQQGELNAMTKPDYYTMDAVCRNCGNVWKENIPKGRPVIQHQHSILCSNCELGDIEIRKEMRFR